MSDEIQNASLHPVLKRIYANRHINSLAQIDYSLDRLANYKQLKGIDTAANIVADAVVNNQQILIVGDYDADGATSTALVVRALNSFGAGKVNFLVPNRFEYGYGLTPEIVDVASEFCPEVLITVDNGISSIDGVNAAKSNNIKVVVTDHHLPGQQLPDADAIVNPNQPGCEFPSKSIAGVGVAFYLMLAVRAALRDRDWFSAQRATPNMADLLDLVALGTVADVVPLDENNRILVEQGIRRMRGGKARAGIRALFRAAGKDIRACTSTDLGFFIGPRLNAAGRLEDMSAGVECLVTDSDSVAEDIATELNRLNVQRKQIEQGMLGQALDDMNALLETLDNDQLHAGLCLFNDEWHQGVIGLLASRIKERFHRPVVAFANANDDADSDEIKGSARSIQGLHIRDVLDSIATRHPGLIQKFGGHAMAAGLSISRENFDAFKRAFEREVESQLSADQLEEVVETDGSIAPDHMSLQTAEVLVSAGPWGQQFPEPVFDNQFEILHWKIVGEKHLKMQLRHNEGGKAIDAIAFNTLEEDLPSFEKIHLAYRLNVNEFRNIRNLQLIVDCMSATEQ
ncbi:MAG: single-stranded-DNA-specific exonuclease RecJ [Gammaproteobacteria bacterium]|nr:single-stranded-DNA-specific exonuclease RecJ [Gammaproteobacteria bacterium]